MSPGAFLSNARRLAGVFACSLLFAGCSTIVPQTTALRDAKPSQLPDTAKLDNVPFVPQEEDQCGPASLAMVMGAARVDVPLFDLKREVFLPGRQGSLQVEMLAVPRRHGLVSYRVPPRLEDVLREVAAGRPVIVLQDYGVWPVKAWHYAVVVGYDYPKGDIILHTGLKQGMRMPFAVLEYLWKQSDYWAMVAVPPTTLPATAREGDYVDAIAAVEKAGDRGTARRAYATFLERWPDNDKAVIGLANTLYATGDLDKAEAVLRPAVERRPDSVALLNNLAQTLSDQGRNAEALKLIDKAAALGGPHADAVRETRAQIVARLNAPTVTPIGTQGIAPKPAVNAPERPTKATEMATEPLSEKH